MVELVDAEETVVQLLIPDLFQGIAQRGMGADKYSVGAAAEKLLEAGGFAAVVAAAAQIEVVRHLPIVEEPVPFELRASERAPDGFFGDGDNHLPYALVGQLVQRNKHQSAAFARSGRSLHEQILSVALFIDHALHFAHTHGIDIG